MTKKLGRSKKLIVFQKLILYYKIPDHGFIEFNETLRYFFPEKFRVDTLTESAEKIQVISKDDALTVIDGLIVPDSDTVYDYYKDLLLYRSRILLENRLLMLGVDPSVSSLGRFRDKTVFVVGAQYPDESVPQVWIDKDTFLPFRWIISSQDLEDSKHLLEIRYLDWRQHNKAWYPMQIEFYENNILLRKIIVDSFNIVSYFSDDLFDIEQMKSIYKPIVPPGSDQDKSNELNEVQKTIEKFTKIYK